MKACGHTRRAEGRGILKGVPSQARRTQIVRSMQGLQDLRHEIAAHGRARANVTEPAHPQLGWYEVMWLTRTRGCRYG